MASNVTNEDACFFNILPNSQLITSGHEIIQNIVQWSKDRGDGLDVELCVVENNQCHIFF